MYTHEPITYSFTIPDVEDTTISSRENAVPSIQGGDKSSFNHSRDSKSNLSNGVNANSSRVDLILGNSVADVDKFLDGDLTLEMEEFEAEFVSQQEQMMKFMQENENIDPDNFEMQFSDDPELMQRSFSRDQNFSIGMASANRRDPVEDIIAPHRAPSRGQLLING